MYVSVVKYAYSVYNLARYQQYVCIALIRHLWSAGGAKPAPFPLDTAFKDVTAVCHSLRVSLGTGDAGINAAASVILHTPGVCCHQFLYGMRKQYCVIVQQQEEVPV